MESLFAWQLPSLLDAILSGRGLMLTYLPISETLKHVRELNIATCMTL